MFNAQKHVQILQCYPVLSISHVYEQQERICLYLLVLGEICELQGDERVIESGAAQIRVGFSLVQNCAEVSMHNSEVIVAGVEPTVHITRVIGCHRFTDDF